MGVDYGEYFGTEDPDKMLDIIHKEGRMECYAPQSDEFTWLSKQAPMVDAIAEHSDTKITYALVPMKRIAGDWREYARRDIPLTYEKRKDMLFVEREIFAMIVIPHKENDVITYHVLRDGHDSWFSNYHKDKTIYYPVQSIHCEDIFVKPIVKPENIPIEELWAQYLSYREWDHSIRYHDALVNFSRSRISDDGIDLYDIGDAFYQRYWTPFRNSEEYRAAKKREEHDTEELE